MGRQDLDQIMRHSRYMETVVEIIKWDSGMGYHDVYDDIIISGIIFNTIYAEAMTMTKEERDVRNERNEYDWEGNNYCSQLKKTVITVLLLIIIRDKN